MHYVAIIATCQVNEASLTLDMLQLSRGNVNPVVHSYLSPTPVGVGVGTSLIWAVDQTLSSLRESGYARLLLWSSPGLFISSVFPDHIVLLQYLKQFPLTVRACIENN